MGKHSLCQPATIGSEVPTAHRRSGQRVEHGSEEEVEDPEAEGFASFGAAGDAEHPTFIWCGDERLGQTQEILGPVLSVCVHRDDQVGLEDLRKDEAQTEHQGSLVSQVERRGDHPYVGVTLQLVDVVVVAGRIVNDDEMNVR